MKNQNMIVGCLATAVIAGGVGVFGGMTYQKTKTNMVFGQRAMGQRNGQNQNGPKTDNIKNQAPMMGRGAVSGEVTAKDEKTITVKMSDGGSRNIILSGTTTYRMASESSLENVEVGKTIAVFGTPNSDGSTTATSIEINPINRMEILK